METFLLLIARSRRSVICCALLVEGGVDAGDDHVHLLEHGVGKVERAVTQDVDLDAGHDGDAFDLVVGGVNASDVLHRPLVVEAVGHGQVLGVVGDGDVLVAALLGGLGHFLDGVACRRFRRCACALRRGCLRG